MRKKKEKKDDLEHTVLSKTISIVNGGGVVKIKHQSLLFEETVELLKYPGLLLLSWTSYGSCVRCIP